MPAMPVYMGQKTMFSLPNPSLLYCSWPEPHLMATLGYTEAKNLAQPIKGSSVGPSQIAEEGSYQVGSVLTEAKAPGCHFDSSGQVGWAGSVPC